jgi:TM2 domain-containing membrane protein YozV
MEMKKITLILLFFAAMVAFSNANASQYSIDEQAVDELFDSATETSMISINANDFSFLPATGSSPLMANADEKDAVVAIVLDFFLGGLGIHRFYLGTETLTGLAYIFTCGGIFGVVPLIDFVVLIINHEDISPYINNPKFFMW